MQDHLQCAICFECFNQPVCLPCGHTFCHACVKPQFELEINGCAICREIVTAGTKLKVNISMRSIVDEYRRSQALEQQDIVTLEPIAVTNWGNDFAVLGPPDNNRPRMLETTLPVDNRYTEAGLAQIVASRTRGIVVFYLVHRPNGTQVWTTQNRIESVVLRIWHERLRVRTENALTSVMNRNPENFSFRQR